MQTEVKGLRPLIPPYVLSGIKKNPNVDAEVRTSMAETAAITKFIFANKKSFMMAPLVAEGFIGGGENKTRMVRDAKHKTSVSPTSYRVVRKEGNAPASDQIVNDAYDKSGIVWDFYKNEYQWVSLDNHNMPITSVVHYGKNYANAFWLDESRSMFYGDGMKDFMGGFAEALDVVGHEMTHAVVSNKCPLEYQDQSGALNESIADVFGVMMKQKEAGQSDATQANWLIGEHIFAPRFHAKALRSMDHPGTAYDDPSIGKDPQPDHMDRFVVTTSDNGGVHINSGIPNRAFYLAASKIGGPSWQKAGKVWFEAMKPMEQENAFSVFAKQTVESAQKLGGRDLEKLITEAWKEVGVLKN